MTSQIGFLSRPSCEPRCFRKGTHSSLAALYLSGPTTTQGVRTTIPASTFGSVSKSVECFSAHACRGLAKEGQCLGPVCSVSTLCARLASPWDEIVRPATLFLLP